MDYSVMTKIELEATQPKKEHELQECLKSLSTVGAEKRRVKRLIMGHKTEIAKLNEELETWMEAVEKALINKETIHSELKEIQNYIYAHLRAPGG